MERDRVLRPVRIKRGDVSYTLLIITIGVAIVVLFFTVLR